MYGLVFTAEAYTPTIFSVILVIVTLLELGIVLPSKRRGVPVVVSKCKAKEEGRHKGPHESKAKVTFPHFRVHKGHFKFKSSGRSVPFKGLNSTN